LNILSFSLFFLFLKFVFHVAAEELNKETGQILVGMDTLPSDLRDYVKEDNKRFEKELEEWDAELAQKAQQEKLLSQIPRAPAPSPAPG